MPEFGDECVAKDGSADSDELVCEAAGLSWLAQAEPRGGIRIVRVKRASRERLVEERIHVGRPSPEAARRIGRSLARTHAAGAAWWGCPPDGCPDTARGIGCALTPWSTHDEAPSAWGAFFAQWRMRYYIRKLRDRGVVGKRESDLLERVADRVERGDFDAPQPALVRDAGFSVARLHGDLWAGNVLYLADPDAPTGAALIDPMAYGGHAETDLAMLALFGFPYLEDVRAGYNEVSPLADGWRERVGVHQLAPLLLHCVLFGGSYVYETLVAARRFA